MSSEPSSPVLVLGVAGRVGSGASYVAQKLRHSLSAFGYEVELIDITSLILLLDRLKRDPDSIKDGDEPAAISSQLHSELAQQFPRKPERTRKLQDLGNELRKARGTGILAAAAATQFISPVAADPAKRIGFVIDSLKHPDEVLYLKRVFAEAFYLVGVTASDRCRQERLRERKGYDRREEFLYISARDAEQDAPHGQKAIETVLMADYFVVNEFSTKDEISNETDRLVKLIFSSSIASPRSDEFAMNVAFKAAARSACLSRQVGAALTDSTGRLISTGWNDVPRFGGGLYLGNTGNDQRCWARGAKCYNDEQKKEIGEDLVQDLVEAKILPDEPQKREAALRVVAKSRVKRLIEFSRAVHAEMEAILSAARRDGQNLAGATLYCTTYPCHNCAKHILCAGVSRVVYLEPYEKSLAIDLHSDAINSPIESAVGTKLTIDAYGGVSPRRYEDFFEASRERKNAGAYIDYDAGRYSLVPLGAPLLQDFKRRLQEAGSEAESIFAEQKEEKKELN